MKTILKYILIVFVFVPLFGFSQTNVSGTVTEQSSGFPLPGVNVVIQGTTTGTSTDFDGKYQLNVNSGDVIVFSYIGFITQEIPYTGQATLDIVLQEDAAQLDEVVVIGYGSVRKEDATGSVDLITDEDFNKGAIVSTDQLLTGKAAGVRITNTGGSPDSAPNIRIRGGSSLNAQNNPLIVIDGVPVGFDSPAGVSNPLNLVNPNDIESFSILKDASATAIYGSRASNGVIIITTKKGTSGDVRFNFSTDMSVSVAGNGLNMMNSNDFVRFIEQYWPNETGLLGVPVGSVTTNESLTQILNTSDGQREIYNTDWRENILRTAFTGNTNFSARANLFDKIPFRGSIGYTNAAGIVKTDDYERFSASFKLTPKFLDNNLKVDINSKLIYVDKNAIDADGALGGALGFNPTQPVFNNNSIWGGYFQNAESNGSLNGGTNPLALLEQRQRPERVFRFLGNVELDYKMPFLPELRAVVNLGLDASRAKIEEFFDNNTLSTYRVTSDPSVFIFNPGLNYLENQHITNTTLDIYGQYTKDFENSFVNQFDIQAGYSYQNFKNDGNKEEYQYYLQDNDDTTDDADLVGTRVLVIDPGNPNNRYLNQVNLQSFFGRTNINLADKYLITLSVRADGSSLFVPGDDVWNSNVWGIFPAAALAWKVTNESFMQNINFINNLKVRFGWGETGQQDITGSAGFYPSTALFSPGNANSQYFPNTTLYGALPFSDDITWEKTTTYNLGVDFDFFKNSFISGSFDIYKRETTDLLAVTPVPPGQGLTNEFIANIGETESEGFELALNFDLIETEDFNFYVNTNLAYNNSEVTNLSDLDFLEIDSNLRGTGTTLRFNSVGQQIGSALVLKQVYDESGNPIPGAFADLNGDNVIDRNDRYFKQITPNWTYGFSINFNYKNWDFSSNFRGQVGGNIYNLNKLNFGFLQSAVPQQGGSLTNVLNFYEGEANPVFQDYSNDNLLYSDYFLEDASFLRCDNLTLGHRFDSMIKNGSVRVYGSVTNPFIITDYQGQDPENFGGIDGSFYPRPTVYTFGLNIDF